MTAIDYCILGLVALSILIGVVRGFVRDTLGFFTWILAFASAYFFGGSAAVWLSPHIAVPALRIVAGYALIFFTALILGSLVSYLLGSLVRKSPAAGLDRTLGAGFGLVRGVLVVVVLVMLAGASTPQPETWWRNSILVPPLVPLANALRAVMPQQWVEWLTPRPNSNATSQAAVQPAREH